MSSQNISQAQNYNQNVPQQASHSVFFNYKPQATVDCSENYSFFQQNKNITYNKLQKHNLKFFCQILNAAEPLQMTMNPYLWVDHLKLLINRYWF